MRGYHCESCGKAFDPEKDELCPRCGATVRPSVLTGIQRKKNAAWLRSEGKYADPGCHEDDAWSGSYGARTHRAAVHAHEAELRAANVAHNRAANAAGSRTATPAARQQSGTRTRKKGSSNLVLKIVIGIILLNVFLAGGLGELFTRILELVRKLFESFS